MFRVLACSSLIGKAVLHLSIIYVIPSLTLLFVVGHVSTQPWLETLKGRDHLEDPDANRRTILK
jgi:hypothetical protein